MRKAMIHGAGDVRLEELAALEATGKQAVVRVHACGICGTDVGYVARGGLAGPGPEPLAIGHEISGVVEALGPDVLDHHVGDRVVVCPLGGTDGFIGSGARQAGLADVIVVEDADAYLVPVPDDMDLATAALAEPVAVAMNGVDRVGVRAGEKVVIFGGGMIGLAALAICQDLGATDVVVLEPSATRRALALDLGASAALDPLDPEVWRQLRAQHGRAAAPYHGSSASDVWIEASGADVCIEQFFQRSREGARMVVIGLHISDVPVSFLSLLMKQLTVFGAMNYPENFERAVELLARRDLSSVVTAHHSLDELDQALDALASSRDHVKILIHPEAHA